MPIPNSLKNPLVHLLVSCAFTVLGGACSDDTDADSGGPSDADSGGPSDADSGESGGSDEAGAGGSQSGGRGGAGSGAGSGGAGSGAGSSGGSYTGPTVGTAKQFAVLAYDAVTTANVSTMVGNIGVSAAAVSEITGFDGAAYTKYGNDSLAPNAGVTGIAQGDVTALVGDIDPRKCDHDLTSVPGGLTGDVTLAPGVTCMNSFSADVSLNGHVYLDAGGDANAFFIIRGNKTLTVANGAQVVLLNNARSCGVFWRISEAVSIGKTVDFHGTVIAGTAITMQTGSSLTGRALAQTAGVHLDANTVTAPRDAECPHIQ